MRRFGSIRRYADGDALFETGQPAPGMFVVLSGHVAITQRDGLGRVTPIVEHGPGQFLGEVSALSSRRPWSTAMPRATSTSCSFRRKACARCSSPKPNSASGSCAP